MTLSIESPLAGVLPDFEVIALQPTIEVIEDLKKLRNAIILAHNYMTPDIYHGVADYVGDSLGLARMAAETEADVIVMAGVHFMAETAKMLSPSKTVLIPDLRAGCSLAESITGADVRLLKERYPGVPVVTYVNSSADVKAESDICCTSSNAVEVVESLGTDRVIFLPDEFLGQWVASQTGCRGHPLEGPLHGPREVYAGGATWLPGEQSRHPDHRSSRVPAGRARRSRFRWLDFGHDQLGCRQPPGQGRHGHRVLHVGQCRRRVPGG